ncbi:uncharacterized protein M6B38_292070 [Iris pallida]|uniref:Uncharacterized protein n=1 Tax=Iris pallida TaxID=29817 RepID=A0AAX6HV37_IRIPA|nr:uncharacterized protein M6B38_292070 [Iris pallida]
MSSPSSTKSLSLNTQSHRSSFPMEAPVARVRRTAHAPPPSPVASAATNPSFLADRFPPKPPFKVINFPSLVAGEEIALRRMMASASEVGAFVVDGWDLLLPDDVRSTIDAGRGVFDVEEESRVEGFWRGDEFRWDRNIGVMAEVVLEGALTEEGYRIFREKMETVVSRLEIMADTITKILAKNVRHESLSTEFHQQSVLCLRKHDNSDNNYQYFDGDATKGHEGHILCLLTGDSHNLNVHLLESSTSFTLPAGFILVTIGKPFQEWCNGELKAYCGEIALESSKHEPPPVSLEFVFSPPVLCREPDHGTISLMDQLLAMLAFALLCKLCY